MSEMVERVARVLVDGGHLGMSIAFLSPSGIDTGSVAYLRASDTQRALSAARAAIEAMREPTEAMIENGSHALVVNDDGNDPREVWQLMHDKALE